MALTSWNEVSINAKLINASKKRQFVGLAKSIAMEKFIEAKEELIQDIEEHPVSQELQQGNESSPDSQFIEDGSLRAFIGFYPEDNPVGDLKDYFNDHTTMGNEPRITDNGTNKIFYNFKVNVPSYTQVDSENIFATPGGWRSSSWVSIIEKGTSTAVHFIMAKMSKTADKFAKAGSRSGWGLQDDDVDTGRSFTATPYVTEIVENFLDKFK